MGSKPIGISASRGAAVLGLSEYATPFEVWQRIYKKRRPGFNAVPVNTSRALALSALGAA